MDTQEWIEAFIQRAQENGDRERLRLVTLVDIMDSVLDRSPSQALQILDECDRLAKALDEPCWMLFYRQLRAEVHTFFHVDMRTGLDVAARAVVEARKPEYRECPTRAGLMSTLINAYVYIDPVGYHQQIIDTIDLIENEMQPDALLRVELEMKRAVVEAAYGNVQHALQLAYECLAASPHNGVLRLDAYTALCEVLRISKDFSTGLHYAELGVEAALKHERHNIKRVLSQFWAYYTLCAYQTGDAQTAETYYKKASNSANLLNIEPFYTVPALLADYQTARGDYAKADGHFQEAIAGTDAAGSVYASCIARAKRCRVLGLSGQLTEAALQNAREHTENLVAPQRLQRYLDRLAAGDYAEWHNHV